MNLAPRKVVIKLRTKIKRTDWKHLYVESKTNKMALVWWRQHKVYKTKWSHSCQPVSHDTLVQEGKLPKSEQTHLARRHTWDICTCDQNRHVCRVGPPIDTLLGKFPTCQQGGHDTYQETQKGGAHHCQGITEAGSRPLLRQPSSTHQSAAPWHADLPWHQLMEAPPCWTEDFAYPSAHLAPETLPCKILRTPLCCL